MTEEERFEKLLVAIREYKEVTGNEIKELKALVAKLARDNESMKPFMCGSFKCKDRQKVKLCPNCGQVINTNKK